MQLALASLRTFLARGGRVLAVLEDGAGARRLDEERARQLQELREKTEALAQLDLLKSRFMSDISHELRTPLAAIKLHVTLARIGRPERRSHYLQTIEQETHRLETMVENVLDVTRIDGNGLHIHAEWLEPTELIGQVLQIYAEAAMQKGISLENATEGTLPRLWVDKNHTVQILANLFDNALKYTPAGGRVWIEARTNRSGAQSMLEISVGDTGPGIAEDEQEKVFERFYRGSNNPRGTTGAGLGLSIIRELMAHLGGTVSVESRPGEGSLFTLHFPLIQDAAQSTRA
jgi:signal transduction histidine kinase